MAICANGDFRSINCQCAAGYTPKCCSTDVTVVDHSCLKPLIPIPTPGDACEILTVDSTGRYQLTVNPANGTTGPVNEGLVAWNYDPLMVRANVPATFGNIALFRLDINCYPTISEMEFLEVDTGTITPEQSFVGLYDATGTRLLQSADITTQLQTVGHKNIPFIGTYVASPGSYYAALLVNGTITPDFGGLFSTIAEQSMLQRVSTQPVLPRFALVTGPFTALPPVITIPSTTAPYPVWVALG